MTAALNNRTALFTLCSTLFLSCLLAAAWFEIYYLAAIPFAILFFYAGWQHRNLVFLILLCSLPFSAEIKVTSTLGTDFPDELLMVFTAGLFFCYWIYSPRSLSKRVHRHVLIQLLWIGFAWSALTVLFSSDPVISLKYLLAKSWYLGAFVLAPLIVLKEKKIIRAAAIILAMAMLVAVIIVLYRHYQYGFLFAHINEALQPFFRNHVNYAAMLVCLVPVFFAFYSLATSRRTRRLIAAAIIILLAGLFLSYSRGAWLALFTGSLAWWSIKKRLFLAGYLATIALVLASLFWIKSEDRYLEFAHHYRSTIFHENFREHLAATYQFRDLSTAERFYRWIAGIRMIKDNPLVGYGPNTFYYNYKPYAIPAFKTYVSDNKEHSTVHNYFLLITDEQGIPGLVFFVLLATAMIYYSQHLYHRVKDRFYKTIALATGSITMMILTVNFLSDLIETDKVGSLFYLCLSLLIVTDLNTRYKSDPSPDVQGVP